MAAVIFAIAVHHLHDITLGLYGITCRKHLTQLSDGKLCQISESRNTRNEISISDFKPNIIIHGKSRLTKISYTTQGTKSNGRK